MVSEGKAKDLASFLSCLSILESNVSLLYKELSDKVEMELPKSLLLTLSTDSQKHSIILKGVSRSIFQVKVKPKDCQKRLGDVWRANETFYQELSSKQKMGREELQQLAERLVVLESALGEEYYVFVQLQTLKLLAKEIQQLYNVDIDDVRSIFESIIRDEEHHREILARIRKILVRNENTVLSNTPFVKYQTPNLWTRSLPSTTQDE